MYRPGGLKSHMTTNFVFEIERPLSPLGIVVSFAWMVQRG